MSEFTKFEKRVAHCEELRAAILGPPRCFCLFRDDGIDLWFIAPRNDELMYVF